MRVGGGRLHRDLGRFFVIAVALAGWAASTVPAQQYPESLFREMRWREIGPLRAARRELSAECLAGPSHKPILRIASRLRSHRTGHCL
jgi:hypothetical protein